MNSTQATSGRVNQANSRRSQPGPHVALPAASTSPTPTSYATSTHASCSHGASVPLSNTRSTAATGERTGFACVRPWIAVAVLSASLAAPLPALAVSPTFSVTGKGWGHGIGMSQYGAKGYALAGKSCDEIITWFYRETTVAPVTTKVVTVNLEVGKARRASWTLRAGWAGERLIVNGVQMPADHAYRFEAAGTSLTLVDADVPGSPATYTGTVTVASTAPSMANW